jgi:hypothetical protein
MSARKGHGTVTGQHVEGEEEESEGTREARAERGLEEGKRKKKSSEDCM